jgi:hypothetical protein
MTRLAEPVHAILALQHDRAREIELDAACTSKRDPKTADGDVTNSRCSFDVWNNSTCASLSLISAFRTIASGKVATIVSRTAR